MQRLIAYCFYGLFLFTPLIWFAKTSELFEFNKLILTYLLTVIIVGAWVVRMIIEKRVIFKRTSLDIPLVIFLVSQFVSLAFSIDQHTSIFGYYSRWNGGVLSLLAYALLYWSYVSNMTYENTLRVAKCQMLSAIVVSIWAILEHFGYSVSCLLTTGQFNVACWVQDVQTRVFATLGQPNWLAAYIVALIFIPLIDKKPLFILFFLTLLFTKSRSGLLAFGISAIVFWLLQGKTKIKEILLFTALTLTLTLTFQNPIRDYVMGAINHAPTKTVAVGPALETGGTESGEIRKIVWSGAIKIWLASPKNFWVGTGPETLAMSYYHYRPIEHNQTSEWELLYNKAHNEFLNYLATTGLIGSLSYALSLVVMGCIFIKSINDSMTAGNHRMTISALLAGWLSISITNFWGFSVVIMQLFLFLFPAMATALNTPISNNYQYPISNNWLQKVCILFTLLIIGYLTFGIGTYWLADTYYAAGIAQNQYFAATQNSRYIIKAFEKLSQSYKLNPSEPFIAADLSLAAAYLKFTDLALAASDQSINTSPLHPNFYKTRAKMFIVLSEIDPKYLETAAKTLEQAMLISPTDPRIPYNLSVVYKYLEATPSAVKALQRALELKPDFAR